MPTTIDDILVLGDPRLYQQCAPIEKEELSFVKDWVQQLHEAMEDIRRRYNFGRGIAAPQLGIMKQLVYINIDRPLVLINPTIELASDEMFELWDDCMSFPNLLVKVRRHKSINVKYWDTEWRENQIKADNALSELLQHEIDHLNGVLCTMRAIDNRSYRYKK